MEAGLVTVTLQISATNSLHMFNREELFRRYYAGEIGLDTYLTALSQAQESAEGQISSFVDNFLAATEDDTSTESSMSLRELRLGF